MLRERGHAVVGPTVCDGVTRFCELGSARADHEAARDVSELAATRMGRRV